MGSRVKLFLLPVFFLLIYSSVIYSQKVPVYEMIGKRVKSVTNTYGKPVHRDKSDPTLECLFYQTKTLRMVFVAGKTGVFQAESTRGLNSSNSAKKHLSAIIAGCIEKGINVDTLNAEDYKISNDKMRAEVTLFQNSYSKKYEVRVKATR